MSYSTNIELMQATSTATSTAILYTGSEPGSTMEDDRIQQHDTYEGLGCCGYILFGFSLILMFFTLPFSLCYAIKIVSEYERVVIFRLGRVIGGRPKGPGLFFIVPCIDSTKTIDLRTKTFDIPPQEILTKDSVTVSVDAVVFYRISNPTLAVLGVEDADKGTQLLAQTSLRNCAGMRNLSELLQQREDISNELRNILDPPTDSWGVKVERVEIKDIRLPLDMQRSMAAEAEASREARAKVIAAEGERNAARALKEASDIMSESSSALQLRYLQTLSDISAEKNSTIVFPLPMELVSAFKTLGGAASSL